MQGGKGAVGSVLEAAVNVAASAKSGLDKTKAVVEENVCVHLTLVLSCYVLGQAV